MLRGIGTSRVGPFVPSAGWDLILMNHFKYTGRTFRGVLGLVFHDVYPVDVLYVLVPRPVPSVGSGIG